MPKALGKLKISPSQRTELEALVRRRTESASLMLRARMILLAGEGESNRQIGLRFKIKPHTVGTWRTRFESRGCEGLRDHKRPGRPLEITTAQKQRIVHTVCRKPPAGLGRWSVRSLANALCLNRDVIHRTLVEHDLQPQPLG
ncbi:MAG: helix-turn-helix domain containing protein [Verrucomicrobia bacterium]|nr:helix-turn-helix domain containing protein [Verrucomicrobiota bacterium]